MKKLDLSKPTVYRFSEDNMNNGATVVENLAQLEKLITVPVKESKVYFSVQGGKTKLLAPNHKAITVNDEIVAVQRKSYKLIPNENIIMPIVERLSKTEHNWEIDPRHSYLSDTKMRVSIKFPDLKFSPDGNEIAMALNVSNSYDSTERVKLSWGMLRLICTNGMTAFKVLASASRKHTVNFDVDSLAESIYEAYEAIPVINERIQILNTQEFLLTDSVRDEVESNFGKRAIAYLEQEMETSDVTTMWQYYNVLTYYVSHYINIKNRMKYQMRASDIFEI